jgi:hypothetical protein
MADLVPLIVAEMDRVCGDSPMSMKEVVVSISSPHVPNLELVDLPGRRTTDHVQAVTCKQSSCIYTSIYTFIYTMIYTCIYMALKLLIVYIEMATVCA